MPSLTIRHLTTYRYRRAVAFGEHRMMLHRCDSHDQRVVQADLKISPKPRSLRFVQDAFGNHVGIARFSRRSKRAELREYRAPRAFAAQNGPRSGRRRTGLPRRLSASLSCGPRPLYRTPSARSDGRGSAMGSAIPCSQAGRSALSSFSHGCHRASITASFTGGEKRRASSCRQRRCDSAMGVAATSPC